MVPQHWHQISDNIFILSSSRGFLTVIKKEILEKYAEAFYFFDCVNLRTL